MGGVWTPLQTVVPTLHLGCTDAFSLWQGKQLNSGKHIFCLRAKEKPLQARPSLLPWTFPNLLLETQDITPCSALSTLSPAGHLRWLASSHRWASVTNRLRSLE